MAKHLMIIFVLYITSISGMDSDIENEVKTGSQIGRKSSEPQKEN